MNIGIDVRLWNETGVGRYIRNLILGLGRVDKSNTYTLFIQSIDKASIQKALGKHTESFNFIPADVRWHTLSEQVSFARIVNQSNVDLVHFPYFSLPLLTKKPFVVTIHDVIIHHFPTGKASTLPLPLYALKHQAYKQVVYRAAHRARTIIVPLAATKTEVVKTLGITESKVVITEEGVDSAIVPTKEAENRVDRLLKGNRSFFLYVGNAYPHKNLPRLLEAFSRYQKENPDSETILVLVGKSDYFYEKLKKTRPSSVVFLSDVTDQELSVLYHRAEGLIAPSLMEGFGLPALEAMANECLVLASDIPSLREVCGDSALYFDPLQIDEIAGIFDRIGKLSEQEREKMREIGKEKARGYSWERMVRQTIAVYERSIGVR